ncbi:ArsC/Spx/MgsR family protein [Woodsholea maritima]|uniref:ArsC/Spx/MgsR family protein n=1 Tax=Woodsholea maritima TaxID=240237 RepID=UPI000375A8B9|nr:ArsC/Spx/MgsR family protein [Woodsholea maritima]
MSVTVYALKTCDTCRKAIKALSPLYPDMRVVDVREEADLASLLPDWLEQVELEVLLNTRSTTWRTLNESDREAANSREGAIGLLVQYPTLLKRPVIVKGDRIYVGWSGPVQSALGL